MQDFRQALALLPADQREALVLVGAAGFSYEEAATVAGCAIGTIKSRVNRARTKLTDLLGVTAAREYGPDAATEAIVTRRLGGHNS
jgi:RNA polymerase sigma-70 factor (ECF subfamily)